MDGPQDNVGKLKRKQDVLRPLEALKTYKRRKANDTSADVVNAGPNGNAQEQGTSSDRERWSVDAGAKDEQVSASNEQVEDGEQWNNDEWYWDEEYNTWVFTGPKRITRRKDLTNRMKKKRLLGMRRNWETDKKQRWLLKLP